MEPERQQMNISDQAAVWIERMPEEQWALYQRVIREIRALGEPFAVGGAFALVSYTGHWRNTKDLDFFVLPRSHDRIVDVLAGIGLHDYYDQLVYDRRWIYRAHQGEMIVDIIWSMANLRASVEETWLSRGPEVSICGEPVRILPPEALIWNKVYILHRDRCDWTDVLNLIYAQGATLDWAYLLDRLGEDIPLLSGVLSVFSWLCPGRAQALPGWLWERVRLPAPPSGSLPDVDTHRVELLDTRPWFGPTPPDVDLAGA